MRMLRNGSGAARCLLVAMASVLLWGCASGPISFYYLNEDDFHAGLARGEDPDGWGNRTPLAATSGFLLKRYGVKAYWREPGDPKYVSEARRVELARILLDAGADPNKISTGLGSTPAEAPPLHHAAANCQPRFAALMLEYGADPAARAPFYGNVLVNLAALCTRVPESYDVVAVVIDHVRKTKGKTAASALMAEPSVISGMAPLHLAVWLNRPGVVAALLDKGVDANMKVPIRWLGEEWTALHIAYAMGRTEMVEMLLAGGADPGVRSGRGEVAAAVRGRYDAGDAERLARVVTKAYMASQGGLPVSAVRELDVATNENEFEGGWKRFPLTDPVPAGWRPPSRH